MNQPRQRDAKDELLRRISQIASKATKEAKEFGLEAVGTFVPPLGKYMNEQRLKAWQKDNLERMKDTFVAQDVDAVQTRYVERGSGPFQRTVVAEAQAQKWDRRLALSGVDGEYFDVTKQQLAIVNTYDNVMSCLETNAATWIVNSDLGAELGSVSAVLPSPTEEPDAYALAYPKAYLAERPVNIGLLISKFVLQDPDTMWRVIDPLVSAVRLLGPRLGEIAGAGAGAVGHHLVGEAPDLVEKVKSAVDLAGTVKDKLEQASELVRAKQPEGRIDIGEDVFAVQFFATAFVAPSTAKSVNTSVRCTGLFRVTADPNSVVAGVRLADLRATIEAALNGLRS